MGCPTTPLSCLDPVNIFAGVYNPHCGGFADPSNFQAERAIYKSAFGELINNYGVDVDYYINGFNVDECNILYGEHSTQKYSEPFVVRAYIKMEESVSLSRFGMDSDDELTGYISIAGFEESFLEYLTTESGAILRNELNVPIALDGDSISQFFKTNGLRVEPKSDDLIKVTALGCDRPGNRGAKIFRITSVIDQSTSAGLNPVMGHYAYKITAKRYETSMETNAPQELGNDQVYDNEFSGKMESAIFPTLTSDAKVYNFDIDTISKDQVYDMTNTDDSVYGNYY